MMLVLCDSKRGISLLLALLVWCTLRVQADCECGYTVNSTSLSNYEVFTDLIESNFLTIQNISLDTDWKVQRYYNDPIDGHPGQNFTAANVVSNPLISNSSLGGFGQLGGTPGLQIWVRGGQDPIEARVPCGEICTARNDMLYGSFRTAAKLTSINGTCSAMFSYYNDSQEIDVELLSRQYTNNTLTNPVSEATSPLNLVLHSIASLEAGYQTPNTSTYGRPVLPVDVTNSFHEYRFDWTIGLVSFYFDGNWIWDLENDDVPIMPSSMLMSHWSNGGRGWSQGPPSEDAVMTISYFKAYFNSSDPQRLSDWAQRCKDPTAPNAICEIPDQKGAPNTNATDVSASGGDQSGGNVNETTSPSTYFFSAHSNQTANQTVYTGVESTAVIFGLSSVTWEMWLSSMLCLSLVA